LARLAEVHVGINQPRANHGAAHIEHLYTGRSFVPRFGADGRYSAIKDQQVSGSVQRAGRVDYPPVRDEQ
jgi:hypothetical protein